MKSSEADTAFVETRIVHWHGRANGCILESGTASPGIWIAIVQRTEQDKLWNVLGVVTAVNFHQNESGKSHDLAHDSTGSWNRGIAESGNLLELHELESGNLGMCAPTARHDGVCSNKHLGMWECGNVGMWCGTWAIKCSSICCRSAD